jgi:hypothetical protein
MTLPSLESTIGAILGIIGWLVYWHLTGGVFVPP